jgi:CheY-like chemotaxis protein
MNVLVLEDRGSAAYYVKGWIESQGHVALLALTPNDASSHWHERKKVPIDCIMLDLNLPTDGLNEAQKEQSQGGLLSGWVWFRDTVLTQEPMMRQRTIIYSDYIPVLQASKEDYSGIKLVPKRRRSRSADEVTAWFNQIGWLPTLDGRAS